MGRPIATVETIDRDDFEAYILGNDPFAAGHPLLCKFRSPEPTSAGPMTTR